MTISKVLLVFCLVLLHLKGYSQQPENELPHLSNETLMHQEPEECLTQSLIIPKNQSENFLDQGVMLKWESVPITFGCLLRGGPVGGEERTRVAEGFEVARLFYSYNAMEPLTEYRWKVRCACKTDPLTYGPFSEYKHFITPNFLLPYDPDQADQIVLFPNPTNKELNLHYNMEVSEDATISIYSVNGISVKTLPLKSGLNYIDTTELEKGYYIMSIQSKNERRKLSFVKS